MSKKIMIKTQDLQKVYGKSVVKTNALNGISLEIPTGSFACITGPSGHGKSTLLHLIGGLDRQTSGNIFIDGTDISQLNDKHLSELRGKKIGFVFQFFNLIQTLTALENIQVAMMFGAKMSAKNKSSDRRAKELLELVGLSHKANSMPSELSGGQQQKIAIARALANDPPILLMDEPTGNLDSKSENDILEHILSIHKTGKTIVIVTHNNELAQKAQLNFGIKDGKMTNKV